MSKIKKIKFISSLFAVFLLTEIILASETIPFPRLNNPSSIKVDGNQVFITEKSKVYIYSLKNFRLQVEFGSEGEGPAQFKVSRNSGISIDVKHEYIIVSSMGRISYFTRAGKYQKEMKTTSNFGGFLEIGDHFVGMELKVDDSVNYVTVNLYDSKAKIIKELFREKFSFQWGKSIDVIARGAPNREIYDNKIFIVGNDGIIHVFDPKGNNLYSIKQDYEKVKVTKQDQERYDHYFKTDPGRKHLYAFIKKLMTFPDYFPPIRDFLIDDGKIYVLTFKMKDENRELLILDLKGKLIKKTMIPLSEENPRELFPYTIINGQLYQLIENPESEEWELHITPIK